MGFTESTKKTAFLPHLRYRLEVGDSYLTALKFWPVLEWKNEKFIPLYDQTLPLEYAQGIAEGFLELLESKLSVKDMGSFRAYAESWQAHKGA